MIQLRCLWIGCSVAERLSSVIVEHLFGEVARFRVVAPHIDAHRVRCRPCSVVLNGCHSILGSVGRKRRLDSLVRIQSKIRFLQGCSDKFNVVLAHHGIVFQPEYGLIDFPALQGAF